MGKTYFEMTPAEREDYLNGIGALPLEDEYLIPTGARWTCESGAGGDWVIRWNRETRTVQARPFSNSVPGSFSAEADNLPAARREVLRIARLIADGKTEEG
jgi:hypothetical protein